MLFIYGNWDSIPFAFIGDYAALQIIPRDTLEAAQLDGAGRWQRRRFRIIPNMMAQVIFRLLKELMDGLRLFEPIVGISASARATALSWTIFDGLSGDTKLYGTAAATAMLTIMFVCINLTPVLIRTWSDFTREGL